MAARRMTPEERVDGRHSRRRRTERSLVAAVGTVLTRDGIAGVGVNAVAAAAKVNKALVSRYFGGIEGLVAAYASSEAFWPSLEEVIGKDHELLREPDRARAAARMLVRYTNALRRRPATLDLLGWECTQTSATVKIMEDAREARSREVFEALASIGFPLGGGVAGFAALLSAAMNYLAVRGRTISVFAGLRIATDADWEQIERMLEMVLRSVLANADSSPEQPTRSAAPRTKPRKRSRVE
jgi:AcrR family transcriptional regulator